MPPSSLHVYRMQHSFPAFARCELLATTAYCDIAGLAGCLQVHHVCLVQIIDAQKARLKRELETLQISLRKAAAEKERAETEACQLRADLADTSAQRDASIRRDQQLAQHQIDDLERRLQHATCPDAGTGQSLAGKENQYGEVSRRPQLKSLCKHKE